ncbi:hypothetical protein ACPA9J_04630 [Pseudomonas aeruginosa]
MLSALASVGQGALDTASTPISSALVRATDGQRRVDLASRPRALPTPLADQVGGLRPNCASGRGVFDGPERSDSGALQFEPSVRIMFSAAAAAGLRRRSPAGAHPADAGGLLTNYQLRVIRAKSGAPPGSWQEGHQNC